MKKEITDELAKAAYEARLKLLATGMYPKSAFAVPSPTQYYVWDDLGELIREDEIKSLYHKEVEAVLGAFWAFIVLHGTAEMQAGLATIWLEMKKMGLFTDEELARMEGGERQDE